MVRHMKKILQLIAISFLLSSASSFAEFKQNKDWFWNLSLDAGNFVYAATLNSSDRLLGQYCYFDEGTCVYMVTLGITCTEGSEYPSIINSSAGVVTVDLICAHKYEDENTFFITPFDDVDNIIKQASTIGFAVAMEGDEFKVVRFSLSGSTYAIEKMRSGAEVLSDQINYKSNTKSEEYL